MARNRCRKLFEMMQKKRLDIPLNSGIYKIRESSDAIKSWNESIDVLIGCKAKRKGPPVLNHCAADDYPHWLKSIPRAISERFGYDILPGMRALTGDGLSAGDIDNLIGTYADKIDHLIEECERVDGLLCRNIRHEYLQWALGRSELKDLINLSSTIAEGILSSATKSGPNSLGR